VIIKDLTEKKIKSSTFFLLKAKTKYLAVYY